MFRIAIVEDDDKIRDAIAGALVRWGCEAVAVTDWERVLERVVECDPHLVVLDLNLPAYDGFHWCAAIRRVSKVPILVVSSRNGNLDMVMAMNMGADDFVPKPFSIEVLTAKLNALLRRAYDYRLGDSDLLEHGGLVLDQRSSVAASGEGRAELTRNEFLLLRALMRRSGEVVDREELVTALWRDEIFVEDNTLTVNMNRLRQKLSALGRPEAIRTVKGRGYVLS